MTSYYFVNHTSFHQTDAKTIANEIAQINPDNIICLCLEEFDYPLLFEKFFTEIHPYLENTGKKINLLAPYINKQFNDPYIIVEESYGYYHWAVGTAEQCQQDNVSFQFTENSKLFTCYNNNTIKAHRNILVDTLAKYDLIKLGIVTLVNPNPDIKYPFKYHTGERLLDEADFVLNAKQEFIAPNYPKSYFNGYLDIVSESTFEEGEFFVTEKTAKPLGALKPFLVVGPPKFHRHLQEKYGLELYTELFDYSFDDEPDLEKRIEGVVQNLLKYKDYSISDLEKINASIFTKLRRNRKKFVDLKYSGQFIPERLMPLNIDDSCYGAVDASILMEQQRIKRAWKST